MGDFGLKRLTELSTTIIKTLNERNFWKHVVHPSSRFRGAWNINAKEYWRYSGELWWPNTFLGQVMLGFPLIFQYIIFYYHLMHCMLGGGKTIKTWKIFKFQMVSKVWKLWFCVCVCLCWRRGVDFVVLYYINPAGNVFWLPYLSLSYKLLKAFFKLCNKWNIAACLIKT